MTGKRIRRRKRMVVFAGAALLLYVLFWGTAGYLLETALQARRQEPMGRQGAEPSAPEIYAYQLEAEELPEEIFPGDVSYYFYNHLPEDQKQIYRDIYQGLMNMDENITLSASAYDSVFDVESLLLCDHPEIFWYAGEGTIMRYAFRTVLVPTYTMTMDERRQREEKIAATVEAFLARISPGETNYEKLATAFSFITRNVTYELSAPDDQNICSSLINGESVCAGYARGMQYLLQQVGIECLYVYGRVEEEGDHAWNIVNLDGTYVQSDVTFGDRSFEHDDEVNLPDVLKAEYGYMCMDDATAFRDRTVSMPEMAKLPACGSTDYAYYRRHGWFYPEYTDQVWSDVRTELGTGERCWHFQFGSREAYERFKEEVYDNRFSKIALDELGWRKIETYLLANDTLYVMTGWIP